ncbi:MAG: hypothetical protein QM718_12125 [Steroidobacteraceae bacterium]
MKKALVCLMGFGLILGASTAALAKKDDGGVVGNSYASQMVMVDDATMRVTTRKRITGDLSEVNTPGTTMAKALQSVIDAAALRAAVEAKAKGYNVVKVISSRNLSSTEEKRNASGGATPETGFTFAPGHYTNDVQLAIEIVVKLVPGDMPADADQSLIDVNRLLAQQGLVTAPTAAPAAAPAK